MPHRHPQWLESDLRGTTRRVPLHAVLTSATGEATWPCAGVRIPPQIGSVFLLMGRIAMLHTLPGMLAAIFDLNHRATYIHWHFFQMSVGNVVVIVLMLVVFGLALVVPFPGSARKRDRT